MDISVLTDKVREQIEAAKSFDPKAAEKVPLTDQAMGAMGRSLTRDNSITDEFLKGYGLNANEVKSFRSIAEKVLTHYNSEFGDVVTSFDTKPGSKLLAALDGLVSAGVCDASEIAEIESLRNEWRQVAPLRGLAALTPEERAAKAAERKAAKAIAAAAALASEPVAS
jgi:hypothetical protein